jgi:predicted O-linked N-acetylglucosamine transferase (SPINDLY family)
MDVRPAEPDLAALGIDAAAPIFVCPGFPYKYTPRHDRLFVEIARNLPGSQFVFFVARPVVLTELLQARLKKAFLDAGLQPGRFLKPIPWQDKAGFHGLMRRATAFLDTVGFSGFNTAMQAIECDLPIVTREGRFMRGRFASGILRRMGVTEGIAQSDAGYVELATKLAADSAYRSRLRGRIAESKAPLFGDLASIRALEEFLAGAASA